MKAKSLAVSFTESPGLDFPHLLLFVPLSFFFFTPLLSPSLSFFGEQLPKYSKCVRVCVTDYWARFALLS